MTTAAAIRRPAIALGATLAALTLTGPAFGQTVLDGVGSTVEATTQTVQPLTDAVEQAAAPVTGPQPAQQATQATASATSTATAGR